MKTIIAATAALTLAGTASAHIVLAEDTAKAGSYYAGFFRVGHGCDGKATTAIRITIPEGVLTARPQAKPGWTIAIEKAPLAEAVKGEGGHEIAERVAAISWTGELSPEQFDEFGVLMKLPDGAGPLYFPTVQRCGEAEIAWTDIPAPGQAWHDVPHPAPILTLAAADDASAMAQGAATAGALSIQHAWVRAAIAGGNGAAYAQIANSGAADRLIAVKGDIAPAIEIHEMTMVDGVMQMRRVDGLDIPAGGAAELKPGGYHVMMIGLTRDLKAGESVTLTFVFEHAGEVTLSLPVGKAGSDAHDQH